VADFVLVIQPLESMSEFDQHLMKSNQYLIRPNTFHAGDQVLHLESPPYNATLAKPVKITPVLFVAYDVCPAFIIVRNGSGKHWRCPRDQLFIKLI
jgi:hypothetical protein